MVDNDVYYTTADNRILQIDEESFQPYTGYSTDFLR